MEASPLAWLMQCGPEGLISCPREYKSLGELARCSQVFVSECSLEVIHRGRAVVLSVTSRKLSMLVPGSLPVTQLFCKPIFRGSVLNRKNRLEETLESNGPEGVAYDAGQFSCMPQFPFPFLKIQIMIFTWRVVVSYY